MKILVLCSQPHISKSTTQKNPSAKAGSHALFSSQLYCSIERPPSLSLSLSPVSAPERASHNNQLLQSFRGIEEGRAYLSSVRSVSGEIRRNKHVRNLDWTKQDWIL